MVGRSWVHLEIESTVTELGRSIGLRRSTEKGPKLGRA